MPTTFRVMGSRVLVKKLDNPLQSQTIEVVQFTEEPSQFAIVLAVGPGTKLDNGRVLPMDVQAGDTVVIKKLCGAPVFINGEACHLVMRDDCLAILEL
jgi:chaperonin GroES